MRLGSGYEQRRARVEIKQAWCKGCRICVEFCPTGTLELDERFKVKVAHPEKCIACRMCEMRCPDLAIFVTKADGTKAAPADDKQPEAEVAR